MAHVNVYTALRGLIARRPLRTTLFHNGGDICTKCSSLVKCKDLIARLIMR